MNILDWRKPAFIMALIALAVPPAVVERGAAAEPSTTQKTAEGEQPQADSEKLQRATFGSGCFWCGEAVFEQLQGVHSVTPGYSGGIMPNPTYDLVCTGLTGHAEVVQIAFDPDVISYDELLEVFWKTHDPTALNRQGPDEGTQYRSVIFYHDAKQKESAENSKQAQAASHFRKPIVTEIVELTAFYPAEEYHQDYFNRHRRDSYCAAVVQPKVSKVKKQFPDKLKPLKKNVKTGGKKNHESTKVRKHEKSNATNNGDRSDLQP